MKIVTDFSVISKQITKHPNELKKLEYDINAGAAAGGVFVQLHDFPSAAQLAAGLTAPANTSVPLKSWNSSAGSPNNYKDFTRGEMTFNNGVFACVSTTQATLTIGTLNNKFDMISGEVINEEISGTTEVQQSNAYSKAIWLEADGPHTLTRIAVTNLDAAIRYLMLFAVDAPSDNVNTGAIPIGVWKLAATGDGGGLDSRLISFGSMVNSNKIGLSPFSQDSSEVNHQGCFLALSTLPNRLYSVAGATRMNVYAEYF